MRQEKKGRILMDNLFVHRGGVEVVMWDIIDRLVQDGYDVTLAAIHWAGNKKEDKLPPGIHFVLRYWRRGKYRQHTLLWFINRIYARVYDAIIARYLTAQNFDLAISMQEKWVMKRTDGIRAKRKIAWVHTDYSTRIKANKDAFATPEEEKACLQRFERVICVSNTVKNALIQTLGDPGNLCVRYNPINVERIRAKAQEPCPIKKPADKPLLISVGRLVAEKHYLLLLQACKLVRETFDFELWLVGEGEEQELLEKYILENRLQNVRLLGNQINPFPYLAQADLFVSSSFTEGNPLAVQEALVLGVPLVAVNCPAVKEILEPQYGLLVDNSAAALAAGIEKALGEPELLNQFRTNISRSFHLAEMYDARLDKICGLLENGASQEAPHQTEE